MNILKYHGTTFKPDHMGGCLIPLYNALLNKGRLLKTGMVITIETFMSAQTGLFHGSKL